MKETLFMPVMIFQNLLFLSLSVSIERETQMNGNFPEKVLRKKPIV